MKIHTTVQRIVNPVRLLAVATIISITGSLFYVLTQAASSYLSIQPESGTLQAPAAIINDSAASGSVAIRFASPTPGICSAKRFVILGSSTAAGTGASPVSKSWVNLYASNLQSRNASHSVINLAKGGYTTYQVLPTGTTVPAGRPAIDMVRNITAAIAEKPQAIVLNMPTNDTANGYSLSETQTNFRAIKTAADTAGIPIWIQLVSLETYQQMVVVTCKPSKHGFRRPTAQTQSISGHLSQMPMAPSTHCMGLGMESI